MAKKGKTNKKVAKKGAKKSVKRTHMFKPVKVATSISDLVEVSKSPVKKTVLITGAAGFIGSNVLEYLYRKYPHYHFIVLDALTYAGDFDNIPKDISSSDRFQFVYGDVRNAKLVDRIVAKSNIVLHFAAETHVTRSIDDDAVFFDSDVMGTQRIASAVTAHRKNVEHFIHISTSEVYGTAMSDLMDEDHPLIPQSPYAAAKAGADRLVMAYYITYKIPATIIRPFNMFGPRQHLEKVIPRFITSTILGEPLTVHGTGDSLRDFTYVLDLAKAVDLVMHADKNLVTGQVFNVGSGNAIAIKDIASEVLRQMTGSKRGRDVRHSSYALNIGDRPGQVFKHQADIKKIGRVLGWKPEVNFSEGLAMTIKWYMDNPERWRNKVWMRSVPIETESGKIELH